MSICPSVVITIASECKELWTLNFEHSQGHKYRHNEIEEIINHNHYTLQSIINRCKGKTNKRLQKVNVSDDSAN